MTQAPHAAMLFAAGFGTRMKHLTKDRPKPMIPVAGRPLIDHTIDLARDAGVTTLVANLHYMPEVLADHLTPQGVKLSWELPDILETGGGLKAALPLLGDDPVITMNTDAIWSGPNPLSQLLQAWNPDVMDALLMCVPVSQTVGHSGGGDFALDAQSKLSRGGTLTYGGIQILKTELLGSIEQSVFSLNLVWDQIHEQGRLFGLSYPGRWCDVGHPDGIALAESLINDV
ncbi:nucleotidyltransferase family protein [Tropicibacter sp. R16_0]|uniref:nucleotidyltransferase family protein n=1 Tax=Tropicibacter sp. R16_0 TaxID=2821102 RepID=UPI001ADD35F5|nr:nucleotidyltransferase family protein [Tropicibacter sp. R16_0]MBO9452443.1 nucleotidyltransferase family protein [Tropicibacter sp. R16_0]